MTLQRRLPLSHPTPTPRRLSPTPAQLKHPYVPFELGKILESDNCVFLLRAKRTGVELKARSGPAGLQAARSAARLCGLPRCTLEITLA